jgi:hypothetical protein
MEASMAAKDSYAIFPPEHRQVNEFRNKILNFLGATFSYNIQCRPKGEEPRSKIPLNII